MNIKIACVGIIEDNNGKILITKRSIPPFQYQYVMPGGKLDKGESVFHCVKREVFEEVGLKVTTASLFDIYEVFLISVYYLILYFKCNVESLELTINKDEILKYAWVTSSDYTSYNLTEGTKYILEKVFHDRNN
jgi:8-oxo-dGTP diphosphatase